MIIADHKGSISREVCTHRLLPTVRTQIYWRVDTTHVSFILTESIKTANIMNQHSVIQI
jgi:hypothetical protein